MLQHLITSFVANEDSVGDDSATSDSNDDAEPHHHDDDDVIFVCEVIATKDQRERAEKLLLPKNFFINESFEDPG